MSVVVVCLSVSNFMSYGTEMSVWDHQYQWPVDTFKVESSMDDNADVHMSMVGIVSTPKPPNAPIQSMPNQSIDAHPTNAHPTNAHPINAHSPTRSH